MLHNQTIAQKHGTVSVRAERLVSWFWLVKWRLACMYEFNVVLYSVAQKLVLDHFLLTPSHSQKLAPVQGFPTTQPVTASGSHKLPSGVWSRAPVASKNFTLLNKCMIQWTWYQRTESYTHTFLTVADRPRVVGTPPMLVWIWLELRMMNIAGVLVLLVGLGLAL